MRDSSTNYTSLLTEWQAASHPQYPHLNKSFQLVTTTTRSRARVRRSCNDENGLGLLYEKCPSILIPAEVGDVMREEVTEDHAVPMSSPPPTLITPYNDD